MTATEPRVLNRLDADGSCWWCKGTGWLPNQEQCSCDARPFDNEPSDMPWAFRGEPAVAAMPRPEALLAARSELEGAADLALMWSLDFMPALVRLAASLPYLRCGGPQVVTAEHTLAAVEAIQASADDLFDTIDRLAIAARRVLDGEQDRIQTSTTRSY